jgi:hypothetical protein
MIPDFTREGLLPPGEYRATWREIYGRFAWNHRRRMLLEGLAKALVPLREAGFSRVFLDGSSVTDKDLPGDYDVAWDPVGVQLALLKLSEPLFFDFSRRRAAQKSKYRGEFFPASVPADEVGTTFYEFFQIDKQTGGRKGIVVHSLRGQALAYD